ncbi:hypothetical protein HG530_011484 [Fusarium avenaceum]|nr:hypothetical protein HG530_011484 [Fusarium avenaceum]
MPQTPQSHSSPRFGTVGVAEGRVEVLVLERDYHVRVAGDALFAGAVGLALVFGEGRDDHRAHGVAASDVATDVDDFAGEE